MDLLNLLLSRRSIRRYTRIPHSSKGSGDHFGRRAPLPLQPGPPALGVCCGSEPQNAGSPVSLPPGFRSHAVRGKGRHSGLCRSGENRRLDRGLCHCHEQYAPDGPPPGVGQLLDSRPPAPGGGRYLHRGLSAARCSPSRPAIPWRPFSPWAFPPFSRSPTAWRTCPGKKFIGIPSNPFPGTVQKNVCTRGRPGTHVFV